MFQLLRLDYWLATTGMKRSCGELFTTGVDGYRWNYQITSSSGGEFHEIIQARFSLVADSLICGSDPDEVFPYLREIVKHQERMLSDAMHMNHSRDYDWLHNEFRTLLQNTRRHWDINWSEYTEPTQQYETLEQDYRIALMGLAGRAAVLAQSGTIPDASPYMDLARRSYTHLGQLGNDTAQALSSTDRLGFSQWTEWEMQDAPSGQVVGMSPEQYPLTFFAVRLMELIDESGPALDIPGRAKQVLDWFLANSERLNGIRARLGKAQTLRNGVN